MTSPSTMRSLTPLLWRHLPRYYDVTLYYEVTDPSFAILVNSKWFHTSMVTSLPSLKWFHTSIVTSLPSLKWRHTSIVTSLPSLKWRHTSIVTSLPSLKWFHTSMVTSLPSLKWSPLNGFIPPLWWRHYPPLNDVIVENDVIVKDDVIVEDGIIVEDDVIVTPATMTSLICLYFDVANFSLL